MFDCLFTPLGNFQFMHHSFPSVEALEFRTSLILVPLLCGLKNHGISDSALLGGRLLIVNLIESDNCLLQAQQ
jgi:hypothetical protein